MKEIYMRYRGENEYRVLSELQAFGKTFEVHRTNYTSIIKTKNKRIIFNENGEPETESLKLLNKVRTDAARYIKNNRPPAVDSAEIKWYFFNDIVSSYMPKNGQCVKLDLNSAYWAVAINKGIISSDTLELFKYYTRNMNRKEAKKLRLKALGSLAGSKKITKYEKGKIVNTFEKIYSADARNLYLDICRDVSELMEYIVMTYRQPYMYWDMVLITNLEQLENIKTYLTLRGYEFKIEYTTYELINSIAASALVAGDTAYPIKKSDKIL